MLISPGSQLTVFSSEQVRRLEHHLDAHRKQPVEIKRRACRPGRSASLCSFCTGPRPGRRSSRRLLRPVSGLAADDRPVDRRGPAEVLRQQRRVVLDRTALGMATNDCGANCSTNAMTPSSGFSFLRALFHLGPNLSDSNWKRSHASSLRGKLQHIDGRRVFRGHRTPPTMRRFFFFSVLYS